MASSSASGGGVTPASSSSKASDDPFSVIKTKNEAERDQLHTLRTKFRAVDDGIQCNTKGCPFRTSTEKLAKGNPGIYHLKKHSDTHGAAATGNKSISTFFKPAPLLVSSSTATSSSSSSSSSSSGGGGSSSAAGGGSRDGDDGAAGTATRSTASAAASASQEEAFPYRCVGFKPESIQARLEHTYVDDTFEPYFLHHVPLGRFYQLKKEGRFKGVELRDTGFYAVEGRPGRAPCSVKVAGRSATCGGCAELGNKSRWDDASLLDNICRTSCQTGESIVSTNHNYSHLSILQLAARAKYQKKRAASARLQTLNLSRRFATATAKINDYERIASLLSHNTLPSARALLATLLARGCGPRAIVNRLADAIDSRSRTKSYTDEDVDLAALVLRLGGPLLLYALNQARGLPSTSYLYKHARLSSFTPTLHGVSVEEAAATAAAANLQTFLIQPMLKDPKLYRTFAHLAWLVAVDDMSIDERPRYDYKSNTIVGFCFEHTNRVTFFNTELDVLTLRDALMLEEGQEGKICLAKEAMVVVVTPLSGSQPVTIPIVALGTCKKSSNGANDLNKVVLRVVVEEWGRVRASLAMKGIGLGPAVTVGTDGDPKRRKCLHALGGGWMGARSRLT
jgi:hypothetical protein